MIVSLKVNWLSMFANPSMKPAVNTINISRRGVLRGLITFYICYIVLSAQNPESELPQKIHSVEFLFRFPSSSFFDLGLIQ